MILLATLLTQIKSNSFNEYNFPLLLGQPNTVFLSQYTPKQIEAPFYLIEGQNLYSLEIQQSILPLFNQVINSNETIIYATNYFEQTRQYSNYFWVLSSLQFLYQGMLDERGSFLFEKIEIQIYQQNCYQINLITRNYGILSCLDQNQIQFLIINSTSLYQKQYITNQSLPFDYFDLKSNFQQFNSTLYQIKITYLTLFNANLVSFEFSLNELEFVNQLTIPGTYNQIENFQKYIFLLDSISIQILNNQNLQNIGQIRIENHGISQNQMTILQINEELYKIAVLETLYLSVYYFDTQKQISRRIKDSQIINPYQNLIQFSITFNKIYIITNNYIMKLEGESEINPTSFLELSSLVYSFIQFERQIIITQQLLNGQSLCQTFLINSPQIQISVNQTQYIQQNYLLELQVSSQSLQQIKIQVQIWIMPQNLTNSLCPIPYKHTNNNLYINYPDLYNIPFTEVFQGPNLTQTITSTSPSILYVDTTSNYIKYSIKSTPVIFLELCFIYNSTAIYCSQFQNKSIEISYWNPEISSQYYIINTNETLQFCSCLMSKEYFNVLMQFNDSIYIQQFNYQSQPQNLLQFTMPIQILSSTLVKETLFMVTNDGILTAFALQNNQSSIFSVSNYTFNFIYTNFKDYPNFLFIDNKVNLMILCYKGYSSIEILNYIQYPLVDYSSIQIGILRTGIYMAIISSTDFLYFYPNQYLYIQISQQNYYQVDLLGYNFQNGQLISTYTSNYFYVILQNQIGIFCGYFSGSGSPYTSFVYSNMLFMNSQNIMVQQMSAILKQEYHIELVQIFTNTSLAMNGSVLFGEFQMVPYYQQTKYFYKVGVKYQAKNLNCTTQLLQEVNVVFERSFIAPIQFNSDEQILNIQNTINLSLQPSTLFKGNIQNYSIICQECNQINYTQPLNYQAQLTQNFSFQAAIKYNDSLYIQNNISLYQLNQYSGVLQQLYRFPYQNNYCYLLFIEKISQYLVTICWNSSTIIYAYNSNSKAVLQYNFSEFQNYYKGNYNNGVLQVITVNYRLAIQTYSYYAFYFWISNNTINLQSIYNASNLCTNSYLQFIYISMSSNFTTQPCQIFGFTSSQKNGIYNPIFYILKTCISSQISQQFGYELYQQTEIENIYFQITPWNLYQTLPIYFQFLNDIQQYQNSKYINQNVVELQFIVPLIYSLEIYSILFNITQGTIIGFHQINSLFINLNQNFSGYYTFQTLDGQLISLSYNNFTYISINVYPQIANHSQVQQPVQIIGQYFLNQSNIELSYAVVSENYLFLGINSKNLTMIFTTQYDLNINLDIEGIQQTQFQVIAKNPQSQSKQSFFLLNQAYENISNEKVKQSIVLYIGLLIFILIVLGIIVVIIIRYYKDKKTSIRSSKYFELENKV